MLIHEPENFESDVLNKINYILDKETIGNKISEMTLLERKFLNGVIRQTKPKKILEIGVAAGGSSAIILNAINDIDDGSNLYSIDYNDQFYRDKTKKSGFIVEDNFPHLMKNYHLYTGGVAAKFIDQIGGNIDLCLIDAMHSNPGEFLDFLMILPYMNKNGILIIHDIFTSSTCLTLFNTIKGEKIIFKNYNEIFKNYGIGAIILDKNIINNIFEFFLLLKLPWSYMPADIDIQYIISLFKKHYDSNLVNFFIDIVNQNKYNFLHSIELNNGIKKINKTAWWIPFKKIRSRFREKEIAKLHNNLKNKENINYY